MPEIARAARANDLDFVLLTDHDTLEARDRGEEGWHGNVLLLVGEEVSPKGQDHFLAFGLERPIDHRGMTAAQILEAVERPADSGSRPIRSRAARSASAAPARECHGAISMRRPWPESRSGAS